MKKELEKANQFLTKQGYTETVTYPDKTTVHPTFQRMTVARLLTDFANQPSIVVETDGVTVMVEPERPTVESLNKLGIKEHNRYKNESEQYNQAERITVEEHNSRLIKRIKELENG